MSTIGAQYENAISDIEDASGCGIPGLLPRNLHDFESIPIDDRKQLISAVHTLLHVMVSALQ